MTTEFQERPVALVDMDGVVADFDRHFAGMCASNGWTLDATLENQTAYLYTDHMPDPEERAAAREYINTHRGWFYELPEVEGAVAGLQALLRIADVFIVTKPLLEHPTVRDEKADWVRDHLGDVWVPKLIITSDKSLIKGDVLLDDYHVPDWARRAEWEAVAFRRSFNGPGSPWAHLRHYDWSQPVEELVLGA